MRPGAIITIPNAVASSAGGRETVQPGLPGKWSVWSQADVSPGAHFVVPVDEAARRTGARYATVKITEPAGETARILLLGVFPQDLMPRKWSER